MPAEGRRRPSCHLARDGLDELLDPRHGVGVVRVGLVPLEHRELGRVLVGEALVAEVLAQLVDAVEPADDEALEVELVGDAEVEVGVEFVVVRDERLGEGTAVARLQHRGLDLEKTVLVEVAPDRRDHARAQLEVRAGLLVHQQVEVALPVARLDVGDAVEGVRERPTDLRQQHELGDRQRRLAALRRGRACPTRRPCRRGRGRAPCSAEQLDPPGTVDEVEEAELPHRAAGHDAPGERDLVLHRGTRFSPLGLRADGRDLVPVGKPLGQHPRESNSPRRRAWLASAHPRLSVSARCVKSSWRAKRAGLHAALISRILNFSEPRGAETSTVSPFFLPMIALPTGDSFESLFSAGFASAEPTIRYSNVLLRVEVPQPHLRADRDDVLGDVLLLDHAGGRSRSSSVAIRCSSRACSFFASSYSEFSAMSPNSRATRIRSATSRRFSVERYSISCFSFS